MEKLVIRGDLLQLVFEVIDELVATATEMTNANPRLLPSDVILSNLRTHSVDGAHIGAYLLAEPHRYDSLRLIARMVRDNIAQAGQLDWNVTALILYASDNKHLRDLFLWVAAGKLGADHFREPTGHGTGSGFMPATT